MAVSISVQQLNQLSSGLTQSLDKIDANVVAQVLAETLPIVGNNLKDAADGGAAQLHYAKALGEALKQGADQLIASGNTSFTEAQVEAAMNAALAAKGIGGSGVDATFTSGTNLKLDITTQKTGDTVNVAVEKDLGLGSLPLETSGTATVTLDTALAFSAGIDASGFYVAADDTDFTINAKATLPNFATDAEMGGIGFNATGTGDLSDFNGLFDIALKDADGKIRNAELNGDLLDATMSGNADIDIKLVADLPLDSALPKIETTLAVGWSFLDAEVNPADDNGDFGETPNVDFNDISVDIGSFFQGFAGDVLREIARVTEPLQPIIDILTTPIPILSDLGSSKVTLLDFAGTSPEQTAAIEGLADLIDLAAQASSITATGKIDLGSLRIDADLRSESPEDAALSIIRGVVDPADLSGPVGDFFEAVDNVGGGGLAFPIIQDVKSLGQMFLGQDADLFSYEAGFDFDETISQFFPVLGPVGVRLGGSFGAQAFFKFGFDAQGVREYFDSGMTDPEKIFNGFYVQAQDEAGEIVTGFSISAGVEASVEANFGIASVGVGGDLTANVVFGFDETLLDSFGKLRGLTLLDTAIEDLFDPSGMLTCGLHAYLEVGFSPFSIEFSFDSPRVVLLNFDGDDATVVLANETSAGVLALNIGDRSAFRLEGNLEDIAEKIAVVLPLDPVTGQPLDALRLDGFKVIQLEAIPNRIVGNGGLRADEIFIASNVAAAAILSGGESRDLLTSGAGNDTLRGDEGPDALSAWNGRDSLFGGAGNDKLIGGAGADTLDGGTETDTASYETAAAGMTIDLRTMQFSGDGIGDTFVSIERYEGTNFRDTITGTNGDNLYLGGLDGDDDISGLGGSDQLGGGKGNDTLTGGRGVDLLTGGEGADRLNGGQGEDTASYMSSKTPVNVSLATGFGTGGDAEGDRLTSIEVLFGSALPFGDLNTRRDPVTGKWNVAGTGDTLEGSDVANTISGLGGADVISGLGGNDVLYGDARRSTGSSEIQAIFDADTLIGGQGNDQLFGQQGDDDLDGGAGRDKLEGGSGDDHLRTLDLGSIDELDGGDGTNRLSADYSDKTVVIRFTAGQTNDQTFADGDTQRNFHNLGEFNTGTRNDVIILDNGADDGYANVIRTNGGNDVVRTGRGQDRIEGGSGNDRLYGGELGDYIDGGGGDDLVHAGSNDVELRFDSFGGVAGILKGTPDRLFGGSGIDTVSFAEITKTVIGIGIGNSGVVYPLGVDVDLLNNTTGRAAIGVTISGFENVIGTDGQDTLLGNDLDNVFQPLRGGGATSGSTGGPDRIDGRGGIDTLVIDFALADIDNAQGVSTNGTTIGRNTIGNVSVVDSYGYANIENLRITGASKNDVLYSWTPTDAPGNDVLSGLGGDDMLGGKGGSDTLLGGDGNDRLSAQGTFTFEYGGIAGGRDILNGGAGDDIVENIAFNFGGPVLGADALFKLDGGSGFDILSVDFSNQTKAIVWDSAAPTDITFADGAFAKSFEQLKLFVASAGNDQITQEGRSDTQLYGAGGDDVLNAGLGSDLVNGGDGFDIAVIDFSALDTADLGGVSGSGDGGYVRRRLSDNAVVDSVSVRAVESVKITGTVKNDSVAGTYGDDTLVGGDGNDTLDGWWGGNNLIDGGRGNDILIGSMGWNGSGSADTMSGGAGDDTISSRTGSDTLNGGAGNDTITAEFDFTNGFGTDTMSGGDGNDVITNINFNNGLNWAKAADRLFYDGGTGTDTLSADFSLQTVSIRFISGESNSQTFADGSFFKNIERLGDFISGEGADELILTGRFNNKITGRGGDDVINPGLGVDQVYGGAGTDLLILDYSVGDVNVTGVAVELGAFYVRRSLSTNEIVDSITAPEFERVQITGSSQADRFLGGNLTDDIKGMDGNDSIRGGFGADLLDGGNGRDIADFSDMFQAVTVTLNGTNAVTATVNGAADDTLRNFEGVTGGLAGDTLTGDSGNNTLNGWVGFDTLTGRGGADDFVFSFFSGNGIDTITDFNSAADSIHIVASAFGGGLVAGGDAILVKTTNFATANGDAARFIYDTDGTDAGLYFDVNGGSAADAILFVRLTGNPASRRATSFSFEREIQPVRTAEVQEAEEPAAEQARVERRRPVRPLCVAHAEGRPKPYVCNSPSGPKCRG